MFESNSKFPKIFVYMMTLLACFVLVGMFFGVVFVGSSYLIAILICAIILILDKKYGTILTNYKLTYLLFEIINLLAVISVLYYEFSKHTEELNLFLILLVVIEVLMALIDLFLLKNKHLNKSKNLMIDFFKLCSMICIITYFFGVSKLYFSIFALMFESMNVAVKLVAFFENKKHAEQTKEDVKKDEQKLEDIIQSNDDVGDGE